MILYLTPEALPKKALGGQSEETEMEGFEPSRRSPDLYP